MAWRLCLPQIHTSKSDPYNDLEMGLGEVISKQVQSP